MTHDPVTTDGISLNMLDLRCSDSLSSPARNLHHLGQQIGQPKQPVEEAAMACTGADYFDCWFSANGCIAPGGLNVANQGITRLVLSRSKVVSAADILPLAALACPLL